MFSESERDFLIRAATVGCHYAMNALDHEAARLDDREKKAESSKARDGKGKLKSAAK